MSLVIRQAEWIDKKGSVKTGDILIKEGKIEKIFPSGSYPGSAETREVDATGQLIIPGMTNAHYHSYSNLLKGTETDLPLELWSLYTVAYGHSLTDEDIYLAVLLGAAEMIRNGVTSCLDHFPHIPKSESALEAYLESGMHVSFAPMIHDVPDHHFLQLDLPDDLRRKMEVPPRSSAQMNDFYSELIEKWHGKEDRIQLTVGPNAPQRCTAEALELCDHLSRTYDLPIHTHLLETKIQRDYGRRHYGEDGVLTHLDQAGILDNRLTVAHAIWLDEWEMDLLKERGVSIVHNPASNMILGSGQAPVFDFLQKGFPVGLGTDASNCGTTHSLFETMKLVAMVPRIGERDPGRWLDASQVFNMATGQGALVLGNENRKGEIAEDFDADLVFLNKNTTTWTNTHDAVTQLVFHENGSSIDSVMIQGEWVLKNKQITSYDEKRVIQRVQERAETLRENSAEAVAFADKLRVHVEEFYHHFYKREE
ncbi:amidohydrolase family protein [Halobacillus litoralis]|uniref:Amidohydrolase family protein n=1 Tax=Halobacillus litoralis TaxID=45668 RepID=A0A845FCW0_9BACI|nr:amidohydrolase family protein [Halobacillus litoralis]MYL71699.1 amidohydrolase family protein [Halobacillus litoralis]